MRQAREENGFPKIDFHGTFRRGKWSSIRDHFEPGRPIAQGLEAAWNRLD
jgi:hypothetical protein